MLSNVQVLSHGPSQAVASCGPLPASHEVLAAPHGCGAEGVLAPHGAHLRRTKSRGDRKRVPNALGASTWSAMGQALGGPAKELGAATVQHKPVPCVYLPPSPVSPGVQRVLGKTKPLQPELQQDAGLQGRYALLTGEHFEYIFARTEARGTYGKVHLGVRADRLFCPLALKELRRSPKQGLDRLSGTAKTEPQSEREICAEFDVHRRVRDAVAQHAPDVHAALLFGGVSAFRSFVPQDEPDRVYDLVFDDAHRSKNNEPAPKAYIVSSYAVGHLHQIVTNLNKQPRGADPHQLRRNAARSFLYQAFVELHVMHRHGRQAHFDLKMNNVLVNAHGAFHLADFGFSLPLKADGSTRAHGLRGSVALPEMLDNPWMKPRALTSKADVMAMWCMGLQFLAGVDVAMPFYGTRLLPDGTAVYDSQGVATKWLAFYALVGMLPRDAQGAIKLTGLGAPSSAAALPCSGNEVVDTFMHRAILRDPALVELALRSGMHCRPEHRDAALAQARQVATLLNQTSAQERAALRQFFAEQARSDARDKILREQAFYAELLMARRTSQALGAAFERPRFGVRQGPAVVGRAHDTHDTHDAHGGALDIA